MGSNIIELAKLGHERAAELKASCGAVDVRSLAQLISDLATQLEVQLVRGNALAAENAGLKAAFDKPQAYLSWHAIPPTWEDPLPCGEYLDVHDEAGHKNSDGTDCWPVYAKPEIKTPAADAFLAEVQAQESKRVYESILDNPAVTDMGSLVDWLEQNAEDSASFAAQLRQGAAL
ncbi:hypothetical protein AZ006_000831 [Citrobacter freundii]|uniref:hypothetical protein n=1 Tax=Citrobacter freundii TaxID=546 RepID=UPI000B6719E2|nr:hypothetical protein [Citrobacter freundii]OUE72667.1 hypothetical protein AZ006_000831 [Citrobacter freundii]